MVQLLTWAAVIGAAYHQLKDLKIRVSDLIKESQRHTAELVRLTTIIAEKVPQAEKEHEKFNTRITSLEREVGRVRRSR